MTKVIAEIGINHQGSVALAKSLCRLAKDAGAWAVKFQKRDVDWCYTPEQLAEPCESPWGTTRNDKVRGRELSWKDMDEIVGHCRNIGIQWACSCFDRKSLAELEGRYGDILAFHKVPSAMAVRPSFLQQVASYRRLTLISTGLLADIDHIKSVLRVFEDERCPFVVNHCVALYPAPLDRLDIDVLGQIALALISGEGDLHFEFKYCRGVGYSGHETGILPSVIAAQMGAEYVERHFTVDRSLPGSDHAASLEPQGLQRLVRDINSLEIIAGSGTKRLRGDEKNPVTYFRE